jgi:hypothetical protein
MGEVKMTNVYEVEEKKLEILRLGFDNQVQYLRMMSDVDLKIFFGYITVQLVLASWLAEHPLPTLTLKSGILLINLAFAVLAINAFRVNQNRKREAVSVLRNLCEALGFTVKGTFLSDKCIQTSVPIRPWTWLYNITAIVATVGVGIVALSP